MSEPEKYILFEDNHLLIVNKPAGILAQGDNTGDFSLLEIYKSYLKKKYNKPGNVFLGLVHRIDRPVSGVVILARTGKALSRMNEQFKLKEISKSYIAITANKPSPESGRLKDYLKKNHKKNKSFVCKSGKKDCKEAILDYKLISQSDRYYLINIDLITGRHHQIRCQLANAGCPVKGDLKYGFSRSDKGGGISLHARKILFKHPVKKEEMEIVAPFPAGNLWNYFEKNI